MINQILTDEEIFRKAPSAFSSDGSHRVSQNYSVISTIDIVEGFRSCNFNPVYAAQSRCRKRENLSFVKHMIRFRYGDDTGQALNGSYPEIVLVNSHDGASAYQLTAGVFRVACLNGMIAGMSCYQKRIMHKGDVIDKVVLAAHELIDIFPEVIDKIRGWQNIHLSLPEAHAFAQEAAHLKWEKPPIATFNLLLPNRTEDTKSDLWTLLNVVQEKLVKGGINYFKRGSRHTKAVTSINENVRINQALWNLTENYANERK